VWIRKELVKERRVQQEDCFPVSRSFRFDKVPITLSSSDLRSGFYEQLTFTDVL
jgi:hypothetical protein